MITMCRLFVFLLAFTAFNSRAEMLWKPDALTFKLKLAPKLIGGLVLEINQSLSSGESGWSKSRMDVPESWNEAELEIRDDTIYIKVKGKVYFLNAANKGKLSFSILNGGLKEDSQLEEIWAEHALVK